MKTHATSHAKPELDPMIEELSLDQLDTVHGGAERIVLSEQVSFGKADEMLAFVRMNQARSYR